jgi:hypothetical protein
MSSSILRGLNTTNIPLIANGRFVGQYEFAGSFLTVLVNCFASTNIRVQIFEDATTDTTLEVPISTTTIAPFTLKQIAVNLSFPYFKIIVDNLDATLQTQLNINTVYTNLLPLDTGVPIVVSGTVSLTNPTTVRVQDAFGLPITTTAGNLNCNLNAISTATPLHTIVDSGTVGLLTSANTIKIDSTNNQVKVNPTALSPVRKTGLGNTALLVSSSGLLYGLSYQNKSITVACWIKLYDKATQPTSADTPFLIQYLEAVQPYSFSHFDNDCYNAPISTQLWVRATLLPDDTDTTDTGINSEITAFVGS